MPKTALDVLQVAHHNEYGEVGYAWPKRHLPEGQSDLPAVRECEHLGWIKYARDDSVPIWSRHYPRRRDVYQITAEGKRVAEEKKL